jgi:triosephosphate isomerase
MRIPRIPSFGVNPKSYLYGNELIELAKYLDKLSIEYDLDITLTAPYTDIAEVKKSTKNLIIYAQGMDGIYPGRGMGAVLPESIKNAGADGVMLNHAERPMTINQLVKAVKRAKELDLYTIVCADSVEEAKMIAILEPDEIVCEQTALIGTGIMADDNYMNATLNAIKEISPNTRVLQGAGIKNGEDCYRLIKMGYVSAGGTSCVVCADDPFAAAKDMVEGIVRARKELYGE